MGVQWYKIGEQLKSHHNQTEIDEHLNYARGHLRGLKKVLEFLRKRADVQGWRMGVYTGKVEIVIEILEGDTKGLHVSVTPLPVMKRKTVAFGFTLADKPEGVANIPELKGFTTPTFWERNNHWVMTMSEL
jgi:hypothetical protein